MIVIFIGHGGYCDYGHEKSENIFCGFCFPIRIHLPWPTDLSQWINSYRLCMNMETEIAQTFDF